MIIRHLKGSVKNFRDLSHNITDVLEHITYCVSGKKNY